MNDEQIPEDIMAKATKIADYYWRTLGPVTTSHLKLDIARALTAERRSVEPVGNAGTMPGTSGFTMAAFKADDVPEGTSLYILK